MMNRRDFIAGGAGFGATLAGTRATAAQTGQVPSGVVPPGGGGRRPRPGERARHHA